MDYDARTLTEIEEVRLLVRDCRCPQDLPGFARTSEMDSPRDRYFDLRERLDTARRGDTSHSDCQQIQDELIRIHYIRERLKRVDYYRDEWGRIVPNGVNEKIIAEDTFAVLSSLSTICINLMDGEPLARRIDKHLIWLVDDIEGSNLSAQVTCPHELYHSLC